MALSTKFRTSESEHPKGVLPVRPENAIRYTTALLGLRYSPCPKLLACLSGSWRTLDMLLLLRESSFSFAPAIFELYILSNHS